MLSNPVQQNSKWFFVFQVEAQLKLIFLWKFAVQHERSVTTLRRRSRDLAGLCLVQRKVQLLQCSDSEMHWTEYLGSEAARLQKYEFPETETEIVPVKSILYSCFMKAARQCYLPCQEPHQQSSSFAFGKSCLTASTLSKLIPLNYYNFLLNAGRESHKVKWGSDWIVTMFMLSKHEILAQAVWTWDGATFLGLFSDTRH